jgi:hypothetical protein
MTGGDYDAAVTIGEEIQCLLALGWTWDGDKLVHPKHKDVWTKYQRTFSHSTRTEHFDAELKQAVRSARQQERPIEGGGQ